MRTTVITVYILKCCVSVAHSWPMLADLHGVADVANLEASARLQVLHFQPHSTTSQPCNDKIGLTLASVMWIRILIRTRPHYGKSPGSESRTA